MMVVSLSIIRSTTKTQLKEDIEDAFQLFLVDKNDPSLISSDSRLDIDCISSYTKVESA